MESQDGFNAGIECALEVISRYIDGLCDLNHCASGRFEREVCLELFARIYDEKQSRDRKNEP